MPNLPAASAPSAPAALLESVSDLRNTGLTPGLAAQLSHAVSHGTFAELSPTAISTLCAALATTVKHPSTPPSARRTALRVILHLARATPPSALVSHWPVLANAVSACVRAAANPRARAQALSCVSALLAAAKPYAALPAPRAAPARLVRSLVPGLLATLRGTATHACSATLSKPALLAPDLGPTLVVLHAALHAASRELRAHGPELTDLLFTLLSHRDACVRRHAARLLALIPLAHPPASRAPISATVLSRVIAALRDTALLLAHYAPPGPGLGAMRKAHTSPPPGIVALPERALVARHEGLCDAVRAFLATPTGPPAALPLTHLVIVLAELLAIPSVDAYAKPPPSARIDAPAAARLAATLPAPAADALIALLALPDRAALLALHAPIVRAITRRLIADAADPNARPTQRTPVLLLLAAAARAFGTAAFPPEVPALLSALLLSVPSHKASDTASQKLPQATPPAHGPRPRKRRRSAGGGAETTVTPDTVELLRSKQSRSNACAEASADDAALRASEALLASRAPVSDSLRAPLSALHDALTHRLTATSTPSSTLLDAVAAAVAAGAPDPPAACASQLLPPLLATIPTLPHTPAVQRARALLDVITHPRGPPITRVQPRVQPANPVLPRRVDKSVRFATGDALTAEYPAPSMPDSYVAPNGSTTPPKEIARDGLKDNATVSVAKHQDMLDVGEKPAHREQSQSPAFGPALAEGSLMGDTEPQREVEATVARTEAPAVTAEVPASNAETRTSDKDIEMSEKVNRSTAANTTAEEVNSKIIESPTMAGRMQPESKQPESKQPESEQQKQPELSQPYLSSDKPHAQVEDNEETDDEVIIGDVSMQDNVSEPHQSSTGGPTISAEPSAAKSQKLDSNEDKEEGNKDSRACSEDNEPELEDEQELIDSLVFEISDDEKSSEEQPVIESKENPEGKPDEKAVESLEGQEPVTRNVAKEAAEKSATEGIQVVESELSKVLKAASEGATDDGTSEAKGQ